MGDARSDAAHQQPRHCCRAPASHRHTRARITSTPRQQKRKGELQRCVRDHLARQDVAEAVAAAEELVRTRRRPTATAASRATLLAAARNDEAPAARRRATSRAAELFAKSAQLYEACGMSNSASCATASTTWSVLQGRRKSPGRKKMDRMMLLDRAKEASTSPFLVESTPLLMIPRLRPWPRRRSSWLLSNGWTTIERVRRAS